MDVFEKENKINKLKLELERTDYKVLKYIDGELTEEEYSKIKETRKELRRKIRELGG